MAGLNGTRTEKNLHDRFCRGVAGTEPLHVFRGQGAQGGFVQISLIFEETANQEKEHAKRFFKFLEGGDVRSARLSRRAK